MNLRPFIALLAAMPLAFIGGCTPDETVEPPVITVENSSITVSADAHTDKLTYSITNPVEGSQVEAESNQDWIHTFNYDTENTITFEVDANVSDERTAEITISYPQAEPVTVTVTQMAAGESIALDPETLSFLPAGGDLSVTVNSGRAWVMTGESDWVSASAASGDPGAQVTFTAQANESDEPREATFQFICGTNVVPLTVTQSFAGRIIVEKAEYDIPGTANTFSIALQSNMSDVKVEITEGSDWLTDVTTKAMQDMSFEFSATENEGDETRTAVVVFSNADASEQVAVNQEPSFPSDVLTRVTDEEFKTYLRDNFDTDGDGTISRSEAQAVTSMDCSYSNIISAAGIEYFENLSTVNFNSCYMMTELNLSNMPNLKVVELNSCNRLETLNLEGSDALVELNIGLCSALTSVDLSGKAALENISAYSSGLTSIDVSECPALVLLSVYGSEGITEIDVTNNPELVSLSVPNIASVDLTNNTKLESLSVNSDRLSSIDLSANTELRSLGFTNCTFTTVDHTMCPELSSLSFDYCSNLTTIDISKNMKLNSLSTYMCNNIQVLYMTEGQYVPTINGIGSDLIQYKDMEYPYDLAAGIADPNLKKAVINQCDYYEPWDVITEDEAPYLTSLDASGRGIESLTGLDYFTSLREINASNNAITEVDLSSLQNLEVLNLSNNQITSIDLTRNPNIRELYLDHNSLTSIELQKDELVECDLSYNNMTSLQLDYATNLISLNVSNNQIEDLDVHMNEAMQDFDCSNNQISYFNIWSLSGIVNFNCSNNPVSDLSQTTYLVNMETLNVSNTDLITLNLSENTLLRQLIATGCESLTDIYVGDNTISDMQVDDGVNIVNGAPGE